MHFNSEVFGEIPAELRAFSEIQSLQRSSKSVQNLQRSSKPSAKLRVFSSSAKLKAFSETQRQFAQSLRTICSQAFDLRRANLICHILASLGLEGSPKLRKNSYCYLKGCQSAHPLFRYVHLSLRYAHPPVQYAHSPPSKKLPELPPEGIRSPSFIFDQSSILSYQISY